MEKEDEIGIGTTGRRVETGIEEIGPCKKLIKATIEPSRVEEGFDAAYRDLRQNVVVPGFRKGRAPRKLLERRFGKDIKEQVKQDLVAEVYQQVLEDEKFFPISDPEFDNVEVAEDNSLSFEATVEIRPDFKIGEYKGLKLIKSSEDVTEEDVDAGIEGIRLQRAELVTEDGRKAEEGDVVAGDLRIAVGENVLSEQKETLIPVREGRIFGVEVDLLKLLKKATAGVKKSTKVKLPDDFENAEFAGKKAELSISVKEVKVQKLPEVNEEFAGLLGFESVEALREQVRRHTEAQKKAESRKNLESQIYENLLSCAQFDLPEDLLERQERQMKDDMRRRLRYRGVPPKVVEEQIEQMGDATKDESKKRVKGSFILDRIAEAEKIVATEDEVQKLIETLAADHGQKSNVIKKRMEESGTIASLRTQIRREKTVQFVLDKAEITEEK